MPDITGLDFLKTLDKKPYVIITTAYKEYALEGYELSVTDYLLKPFSFERFLKAVNKVLELKEKTSRTGAQLSNEQTETTLHDDYMLIRADRKYYKVNYKDLIYIEGQKAYLTFYTSSKRITALASLKDLEVKLSDKRFIRIHKSYIVSVEKIDSMEGNQIEIGDKKFPVGKTYKKDVEKLFGL